MRRALIAAAIFATAAVTSSAQTDRASRFNDNCRRNRDDDARFCETRDFSLPALKGLVVDGKENGGVSVIGWDRAEIKVLAMIQAQAETESQAAEIARNVAIAVNNGDIRANGPTRNARHESWSVSYEIYVPRN